VGTAKIADALPFGLTFPFMMRSLSNQKQSRLVSAKLTAPKAGFPASEH